MRIIVLGYIVRFPLGGLVWHYLQYVLGLARLGHEVWYVEDNCYFEEDTEIWTYDPQKGTYDDPTYGLNFITRIFEIFGIGDRWAYFDSKLTQWHGPCKDNILKICSTADLVINVSGANPLRAWLRDIPVRAFIDTDPVFTQILQLTNPINRDLALQHNVFFSFGENICKGTASVPNDDLHWMETRQPIVLDAWPVTPGQNDGRFTTIGAWDSYKCVEYSGIRYGMKSQSFESYCDLPTKTKNSLEFSLFDPSVPPEMFHSAGWIFSDAKEPTRDPWTYQYYIQQSKAEFSVAKHGYVISNSGWFSERSAAYLASGRPVVVQETGFSEWMVTGKGVISFHTPEEAVDGIEEVNRNYFTHCKVAREIAEEFFNSQKVLSSLIERAVNFTS